MLWLQLFNRSQSLFLNYDPVESHFKAITSLSEIHETLVAAPLSCLTLLLELLDHESVYGSESVAQAKNADFTDGERH